MRSMPACRCAYSRWTGARYKCQVGAVLLPPTEEAVSAKLAPLVLLLLLSPTALLLLGAPLALPLNAPAVPLLDSDSGAVGPDGQKEVWNVGGSAMDSALGSVMV